MINKEQPDNSRDRGTTETKDWVAIHYCANSLQAAVHMQDQEMLTATAQRLIELLSDKHIREEALITRARDLYTDSTCDIEVDDDAQFSEATEGVWVQGWLWVPNDE